MGRLCDLKKVMKIKWHGLDGTKCIRKRSPVKNIKCHACAENQSNFTFTCSLSTSQQKGWICMKFKYHVNTGWRSSSGFGWFKFFQPGEVQIVLRVFRSLLILTFSISNIFQCSLVLITVGSFYIFILKQTSKLKATTAYNLLCYPWNHFFLHS